MSLIPDWAPNLHPLIVHFPISLLIIAVIADVAALVLKNQKWLNKTATTLYTVGALSAVVAYFTGRNASDTVILSALANPIVNEHSDWALRTVLFFGVFAVVRMTVSFKFPEPKYLVSVPLAIAGFAGLGILLETAEHGAQLVFQHGVGVQTVEMQTEEALPREGMLTPQAPVEEYADPGIVQLEDGSWNWQPVNGAVKVLEEQFAWLEQSSEHLTPEVISDQEKNTVLALHPHGMRVMFVGGNAIEGIQADLIVNISEFSGSSMLVFHVQDTQNFDFLELKDGIMTLGRLEQNEEIVFDQQPMDSYTGWIDVSAVGEGGHFRGLLQGTTVTHGHGDDLPPGKFGLRIEGSGTILIKSMDVQKIG